MDTKKPKSENTFYSENNKNTEREKDNGEPTSAESKRIYNFVCFLRFMGKQTEADESTGWDRDRDRHIKLDILEISDVLTEENGSRRRTNYRVPSLSLSTPFGPNLTRNPFPSRPFIASTQPHCFLRK